MIDYVFSLLLGVISSLIASILFLRYLASLTPKLEISNRIGKSVREGRTAYSIKIINRTNYEIVEVRAKLLLMRPEAPPTPQTQATGTALSRNNALKPKIIWNSAELGLKRSETFSLGKFDPKDADARYAYRFISFDDIEGMLSEGAWVELRIYCRHSLSGFGRVFSQRFLLAEDPEVMAAGEFDVGNTMEIVPAGA